jgi:hypothetical protein
MLLFFNATAWANIADNAASAPITNWEYSLHTADPTDAGNQTSNEAAYTSYDRVQIARASGAGGHTVTNNSVSPTDATTSFPQATGGTETETHFGIGTAGSGTGILEIPGTVTPNVSVTTGVTPQLTSDTAITID